MDDNAFEKIDAGNDCGGCWRYGTIACTSELQRFDECWDVYKQTLGGNVECEYDFVQYDGCDGHDRTDNHIGTTGRTVDVPHKCDR